MDLFRGVHKTLVPNGDGDATTRKKDMDTYSVKKLYTN